MTHRPDTDAKEERDMVYQLREKAERAAQEPPQRECQVIPLRPLSGRALKLARTRARRRRNLRRLGWEYGGNAA